MEIKSYQLILLDTPLEENCKLHEQFPLQKMNFDCPKISTDLKELKSPLIGVVLCFKMGDYSEDISLNIDIQLMQKSEKISFREIRNKKQSHHIYRLLELNFCDCYEKPVTVVAMIKYAPVEQYKEIKSISELGRHLSRRELGLYNEKTYVSLKREVIIKQPVNAVFRYSPIGYIWMKLINKKEAIKINEVRLMTWLSELNIGLKEFDSQSSLKETAILEKDQALALTLSCLKNLKGEQIQYWVDFSFPSLPGFCFKMIKYLYIE